MTAPAPATPERARRGRRTLLLLALVAVAPFVASYAAYYWFPRDKQVNYGELLATRPAPDLHATLPDGKPYALAHGKWVLIVAADGGCDAACARVLYATRQARTMQNREMDRVERVWLVTGDAPPAPGVLAEHPDLTVVRGAAGTGRVRSGRRPPLPPRSARQPGARLAARPGSEGTRQGPRAPAPRLAHRMRLAPAYACKMRGFPRRARISRNP